MGRLVITIFGIVAVIGLGFFIWSTNAKNDTISSKDIDIFNDSEEIADQLKAFLNKDQLNNPSDENISDQNLIEEEPIVSSPVPEKTNPLPKVKSPEKPVANQSIQHPVTPKKPKPTPSIVKKTKNSPIVTKKPKRDPPAVVKKLKPTTVTKKPKLNPPTVAKKQESRLPVIVRTVKRKNQRASNIPEQSEPENSDNITEEIDEDLLYEDEELAYQDAYKRSLVGDPYEREYILEDEKPEHALLAGALTKLDIDRAVRKKDLKKLKRWLKILTVSEYPLEQKKLNTSYAGTKAYLRSAIRKVRSFK